MKEMRKAIHLERNKPELKEYKELLLAQDKINRLKEAFIGFADQVYQVRKGRLVLNYNDYVDIVEMIKEV